MFDAETDGKLGGFGASSLKLGQNVVDAFVHNHAVVDGHVLAGLAVDEAEGAVLADGEAGVVAVAERVGGGDRRSHGRVGEAADALGGRRSRRRTCTEVGRRSPRAATGSRCRGRSRGTGERRGGGRVSSLPGRGRRRSVCVLGRLLRLLPRRGWRRRRRRDGLRRRRWLRPGVPRNRGAD